MDYKELRYGNIVTDKDGSLTTVSGDDTFFEGANYEQVKLTEEWLLRFGFTVINENSAGKRYGYVIDGVFSSDLTFTFWKTTKQEGKFFRGDLELKSVNQFQNLIFALTGTELELKQ